jgi:hypothetical protein
MFSVLIYSYINTRENWENSKLCENTPPKYIFNCNFNYMETSRENIIPWNAVVI